MEACIAVVPYTLLGFLLCSTAGPPTSAAASVSGAGGGLGFFRDYAARGRNALLWIAFLAVTSLLFRKLARLVRFWAQGSKIPGPPSPSFFVGHSRLIAGCGSGADLRGYFSKLHEKYGPIARLWLGPSQLLVSVKDTTLIKEVLIKAEDKLPLTGRAFRLAFGRSSLFVSSFEKVQKRRESLAAYMNGKLVKSVNTIPIKVIECVMSRVDAIMAKGMLDCRSFSQHMAFYILGATFFGDAFLDWSNATIYEELLMMVAKDGCFWASYKIPPFWRREYWKYQSLCKRLKGLTQDIIQQYKCNYNLVNRGDQNSCEDFKGVEKEASLDTTVLLDAIKSGGLSKGELEAHLISEEEPCGNILGLMFHGCLATTSLISSILTRLVLHPELQEKLYSDIIAVQGKTRKPDSQDVQKLHLLLATVYESARLLPAGPLLQRCSLKHDLRLKPDITIPAGTILVIPLQLVQMDDSIWGNDACHFNPHRFMSEAINYGGLSEESSFISEPNKNSAFLPFGSGTRACVGQKFAILAISVLIASLLQNYEIRLQSGFDNDPKPSVDDCILQLLPSPKITFVRRSR